jgi:hypothetical protein
MRHRRPEAAVTGLPEEDTEAKELKIQFDHYSELTDSNIGARDFCCFSIDQF